MNYTNLEFNKSLRTLSILHSFANCWWVSKGGIKVIDITSKPYVFYTQDGTTLRALVPNREAYVHFKNTFVDKEFKSLTILENEIIEYLSNLKAEELEWLIR